MTLLLRSNLCARALKDLTVKSQVSQKNNKNKNCIIILINF